MMQDLNKEMVEKWRQGAIGADVDCLGHLDS